ncbi:hypothetical protein [Allokutzneria oryzae]|uniref:PepSY domain-containing protein n=1 Tax=Allokutzneria oryzae TaxID=1378989 RepID=A0ABV6A8G8_9PSEU
MTTGGSAAGAARRVWIGIGAGVLAAALVAGGAVWLFAEDPVLGTKEGAEATTFGPDRFGKLRIGMTKDEALATGALGPAPVAVVTGCEDYSFQGGPAPEPARMALEDAAEKQYESAKKANAEMRAKLEALRAKNGTSAADFAERAELLAKSAEALKRMGNASANSSAWSAARIKRANESGGVSFGQGQLRLISAPPFARTAEGIGRESTVDELTKAYGDKGMKEDRGRYEIPVDGKPDWVLAFDVKDGKVTNFLMLSKSLRCR